MISLLGCGEEVWMDRSRSGAPYSAFDGIVKSLRFRASAAAAPKITI